MKKILQIGWLALILLAPIVLWCLPVDTFDNSDIITCPSVLFLNMECIGCGITRAVMHFHHFDYSEALFYNYGVVLIYPFLGIMWFYWLRIALTYFGFLPKNSAIA